MNPPSGRCMHTRENLPELALGIADGEQRALALQHAAGCSDCRHELEQLSSLVDDLIALAPRREPPPGFENRVLKRLGVRHGMRRHARRYLQRLSLGAAVVAASAATALAMSLVYRSDQRLASQYRTALQGAHGQYFQSAPLKTPAGQTAGIAFAYQGAPSWLFYVLESHNGSQRYDEQILTRSGRTLTLRPFKLIDSSWGIATPIPVRDIARVRLIPEPYGRMLQATLPVVEP